MPNSLAHLGAQGPPLRAVFPRADVRWILLAYLIPDLPWILQRVLGSLPWQPWDPYALRLYAMVQASLLFCVLAAVGLSVFARRPYQALPILLAGVVLHLLLDAAQTKWANGVHLAAPFSWEITNFGWFWPEHPATVVLSLLGLGYLAWEASRETRPERLWSRDGTRRQIGAVLCGLYLLAPIAFHGPALESDSHSLRTLQETDRREGREVALDRATYRPGPDGGTVVTFAGETLSVRGELPDRSSVVSLKGRFVDQRRIEVDSSHVHRGGLRDAASVAGLALLAALWLREERRAHGRE